MVFPRMDNRLTAFKYFYHVNKIATISEFFATYPTDLSKHWKWNDWTRSEEKFNATTNWTQHEVISERIKMTDDIHHQGQDALSRHLSEKPRFSADVEEQLSRMARTDYPVLLWRGKNSNTEESARFIHENSRFAQHPFIIVSSRSDKQNSWSMARTSLIAPGLAEPTEVQTSTESYMPGGTLYLDEIVALPPEIQRWLLAMLGHDGLIRFIAANGQGVEVRIISASTIDLWNSVGKHTVRADLFFRLNVLSTSLP